MNWQTFVIVEILQVLRALVAQVPPLLQKQPLQRQSVLIFRDYLPSQICGEMRQLPTLAHPQLSPPVIGVFLTQALLQPLILPSLHS